MVRFLTKPHCIDNTSVPVRKHADFSASCKTVPSPSSASRMFLCGQCEQTQCELSFCLLGCIRGFPAVCNAEPLWPSIKYEEFLSMIAEDTVDSPVAAAQAEGSTAQQGVMSAATAVPNQQSVASAASTVPAGASSAVQQRAVGAGGQVPTQARQAASAAYPAQQGVVNAGSNVPAQGSQAAASTQGAVNMGANVPVQQNDANTGGAAAAVASSSAAKATLPTQANSHKAPVQPVQAQFAQSPVVSPLIAK